MRWDIFKIDSGINYAFNYAYKVSERDTIDFSLGYIRGRTFYAGMLFTQSKFFRDLELSWELKN